MGAHHQNPFASPGGSRPESSSSTPWKDSPRHSTDGGGPGTFTPYTYNSVAHDGAGASTPVPAPKRRFKSYRLRGEYPKPWLEDKDMKKTRWNNIIVGSLILLGIAAAGVVVYFMSKPYVQKDYCLVYEDNFQSLDKSVWSHEVQLDGFGNHAFDWTTTDERNSYVDADGLHIVPTLTTETTDITTDQMYANYTLNLDSDKSCTGEFNSSACVLRSNPEKGAFIPPVRSARLTTKGTKSIRYGMVEVVARLPRGDWLWPAIWMMPEDSAYGAWPRSGEIDVMESRGNGPEYAEGGRDWYYGTLHWGPSPHRDAYWRTTMAKKIRRGAYSDGLHTFGIQWTPDYIYFYIDSKIHQILFIGFDKKKGLYDKGAFAKQTSENDTLLDDPWTTSNSTTGNAPFDQSFYLILNVAVGGTNGFFLDNVGSKPWVNGATNARWSFWDARDKWLPTWGEGDQRGLTVRSVKMWQLGACGSKQEL
ncbi:Concanavalin A-like lectin/glucanase, subgroup [Cordyceps fumosorosea ARSEF 2679]|uniref:Concanavalin A-like lectin/glucanase, subgroup n=1 Tax=Cordyceps fumosorosea (strain ARSEF 2679) TaxID=1081104 RepID=A0A168DDQ7_CORFA|nr:Concanavalin A-like lectin/glucanase, subgroup [Cordyceps fumosorosea ARSEF 2679]OAA72483.1 Concanavalin A-like lectin/glucanase, subgroup [Cordyceps fumosorosea ARSEF 2679]